MRTTVLFTALIAFAVAPDKMSAEEPAKDAISINGTWKVVSSEFEGQSATDAYKKTLIVIDGDELFFTDGFVQSKKAKFRLDPSTKPKSIDIGSDPQSTRKGIYLIDKDVLKLCLNSDVSSPRPKEFKTKAGDKANLLVLERQKP